MSEKVCDYCGDIFKTSYNLKRHIRNKHYNAKTFECEICFKNFSRADNLKAHVHWVHEAQTVITIPTISSSKATTKIPPTGAASSSKIPQTGVPTSRRVTAVTINIPSISSTAPSTTSTSISKAIELCKYSTERARATIVKIEADRQNFGCKDEDYNNKDIQGNPINFVKPITNVENCPLSSRTIGLIEVTMDNTNSYTLNCIHCAEKFSITHWTWFLVHMNMKHPSVEQNFLNTDDLQNDNTFVDKENGKWIVVKTNEAKDKISLHQESENFKDIPLADEMTTIKSEVDVNDYEVVENNLIHEYKNAIMKTQNDDGRSEEARNDDNTEFCNSMNENVILETNGFNFMKNTREHHMQLKRIKLINQNKLVLGSGAKENNFESSYNEEFISISSESVKKVIEMKDDIKVLEVTEQIQVNEGVNMEFDVRNIK